MRHLTDIEIQKYLDRELTREEEILLRKHLPSCNLCQHKISEYQKIYEILNQPPEIDLPADFADKVLARIPAQPEHTWYEKYLDQVLLALTLITGTIVFFYFVGIQPLLNFWGNINPAVQNGFNYVVQYFKNNSGHTLIAKYVLVAVFILASIKLFDLILLFRKRDISAS